MVFFFIRKSIKEEKTVKRGKDEQNSAYFHKKAKKTKKSLSFLKKPLECLSFRAYLCFEEL
ncbi:hypothetical protein ABD68_06550 [Bacillus endophyticus]|nr:hypothetical protein [Priestia endophytica]